MSENFFPKKKRGFTLIELLAVIIILGVLMIIAIPAVTEYISNSRKNVYISTISGYQSGVSQKINSLEYSFLDNDTTYYVHIANVPLEKGGDSPFGKWVEAYVVVTYSGASYDYYWTSVDESGHKVLLKSVDEITIDDVINDSEKVVSKRRTVGDRSKIVIVDKDGKMIEDTPALEYSGVEAEECFIYKINNNKVSITAYRNSCSKDVEIPSKIEGYPVTDIGSYAFSDLKLTSVIIPEGITVINGGAFRNDKLTSVIFPTTLTTIGSEAFANNLLTELTLPTSVTSIGSGAFTNNKISEDKAFIYKQNADGTSDFSTLIGYAGTLKDLIIPQEVNGVELKTISSSAFRSLGLTNIVIPPTVEKIGSFAFSENKLTSIILPNNLKTIESAAFSSNKLTSLSIPPSVTSLGTHVFNMNLLPDSEAFIYKRTASGIDYSTIISYGGVSKDNVIIPAEKNGVALKRIENYAFVNGKVTKIVIPNTVNFIGIGAFSGNNLSDEDAFIYKRNSDGSIDYSTIIGYGGSKKESLVIPELKDDVELKVIESNSFVSTGLKSVILPETLITIKPNAFYTCYLTEITIPKNVVEIGKDAFKKEKTWGSFNMLTKIINKTGRSFDWTNITGSINPATFESGTIKHQYGNIEVIKE